MSMITRGEFVKAIVNAWGLSDDDGYKVKLLMTDGNIREFKCDSYFGVYKGQLVKFIKLDAETVTIQSVEYRDLEEHTVNKDIITI